MTSREDSGCSEDHRSPGKTFHHPTSQPQLRRRRRPRRQSAREHSSLANSSYSGDDSASNSGDDGDEVIHKSDTHLTQVRRRNKNRHSSYVKGGVNAGTGPTSLTLKAVQIEAALKVEPSTAEATEEEQKGDNKSRKARSWPTINELAISDNGLINDDFRRRAWPRLADLNIYETSLLPTQQEVENHKSYQQVVLDVNRSLKRFPPGISEEERPDLQDQLTGLIVRVLSKHPDLHYYQGYHDVAITFLLVVGEQLGFHIVERLSSKQLRDFMAPTMEKTTFLLHFMYPIFRRECPQLHDFLEESEVGTIFALPWVITWFSHVLPNYQDVVRLFDFFLAQPPTQQPSIESMETQTEAKSDPKRRSSSKGSFMLPVYLASALVLHRREEVMAADCDMASVHSVLSHIPLDLPIEKLLKDATRLSQTHPAASMEGEVQERVAKIEEAVQRANAAHNARKEALLAKTRKIEEDKKSAAARPSVAWRIIVVAVVPAVISVLTWKYLETYSQ